MRSATRRGHKNLVGFFIEKGANDWTNALVDAEIFDHEKLATFFRNKLAK